MIMAISGLVVSIMAAYIIFQDGIIIKNLVLGWQTVEFAFALCLCLIVVYWKALPKKDRYILRKYLNLRNVKYIFSSVLLSIVTWILSASCFVLCIRVLGGSAAIEVEYFRLLGASIIVSFIASMPVSVNGWGVREFAAITIFSLLAIPGEVALGAAVIIGVLSVLSLLIVALLLSIPTKLFWKRVDANAK